MAKPEDNNTGNEAVQEGAAGGSSEQTMPKSKKESYMESFRKKYPDWKEDDEEGFYGALADEQKAWDEERSGYESREKEVSDALSKGGVLNAALFSEVLNGTPIPLALIKRYPDEIKAWLDDPENTEELQKSFEEHARKIKEDDDLNAEAERNLAETNSIIDDMIAKGEIKDDEEVNQLLAFLGNIATGLMVNRIEREWLIAAKKAINHDADVEAARTKGEIEGRNQKIVAQRSAAQKGSSTHSGLGSSNAGQRLSRKEAQEAVGTGRGGRRSMWDNAKINKLN